MSAVPGGVGPVSVRYAAQIREMLFAQAVDRAVAEQEAARAADEAARIQRMAPADDGVRVDISDRPAQPPPEPAKPADTPATAKLVDIQA